jgi:Tol biopolymer transport system component
LHRCLQKDRKVRLHDMADACIEIDDAQNAPLVNGRGSAVDRTGERVAWLLALGFVTAMAAILVAWTSRRPAPVAEMRVDITTPPTADLVSLAISPDGQKIVFAGTSEARPRLWLRSLDTASARPLEGTSAASLPFWSPDSRSVGFFADGKLQRVDIDGGSATVLANAPYGRGGSWNRDGVMLFVPNPGSPILKISDSGGESAPVTKLDARQQHQSPQFLPDGRHFLYYALGTANAGAVYVGELEGSEIKRLVAADAAAVYAPSGHLLFIRRGTLFAQDFDPLRMAMGSTAFPVAEHVAVQSSLAALSAAGTGPIVYRTGSTDAQLAWLDRSGKELGTVGDPDGALSSPALSPDGRRVAVLRQVGGNFDIYLLETTRTGLSRFTVDAADDIFPIWSPDGTRIVFSSTRKGGLDLYVKRADGTGNDELLLETPDIKAASSWSPDGRVLLYLNADPKTGFDIWALPMEGSREPFPVIQTKANERLAQFSPDGKWIAYESDESGRYEIYVQPWSGSHGHAGGKVPVSTTGGAQVRWQHDGRALFYIGLDDRLMTVPIRSASIGQTLEPGPPAPLFATHVGGAVQVFPRYQYLVSLDDQRFLMAVERKGETVSPITLLLNWAGSRP